MQQVQQKRPRETVFFLFSKKYKILRKRLQLWLRLLFITHYVQQKTPKGKLVFYFCKDNILTQGKSFSLNITRPNYALDGRTILCLYVSGFQSQVFKHVNILSKRA